MPRPFSPDGTTELMATKKKPQDKDQDKEAQQSKPEEEESGLIDVGPDFDAPEGKFAFLKNKRVMIGAGAAILLLGGGGGAAMFMAGGSETTAHEAAAGEESETAEDEEEEEEDAAAEEGADGELPLVAVPPMVVNMRSPDGNNRYLKLRFMLEAKSAEKVDKVKAKLPAILDAYQPFLRELRPEDVSGSAAVFRIKEEMLIRANQIVGKDMVRDVLIQDLIQQ